MYRIEKFLIDSGMKLKKKYASSGCLVYQTCDEDGFYGVDEIILYPRSPNPTWTISTGYPYLLTIEGNVPVSGDFVHDSMSTLKEHLNDMLKLNKQLHELENPWEEIE